MTALHDRPKTRHAVRLNADERRAEVVEAAVTAFAEAGYAGTSTDEIAKLAGVSQPYLFRLFGSKQALFLAAVGSCSGRVRERSGTPRSIRSRSTTSAPCSPRSARATPSC